LGSIIKFLGDLDCILLVNFFPRIATKSDLLCRLLNERFPAEPDGMQRKHVIKSKKEAKQWANVQKFQYYLRALSAVARRFESMSLNCTIESLNRLALHRIEITDQERFLDQYFDLLKKGQFDENTSTDMLHQSTTLLQVCFLCSMDCSKLAIYF
jgi:hypothetical protein